MALAELTTEDTPSPKCHNSNMTCMSYHLNDVKTHVPYDHHGSHATDEVDTERYGNYLTSNKESRPFVHADCTACTAECDKNYLLATPRLTGNELGDGKNPDIAHKEVCKSDLCLTYHEGKNWTVDTDL